MLPFERLRRREFIALSALATADVLMPRSLRGESKTGESDVSLEQRGDAQSGFAVDILFRGHAIARHNKGGEFSAVFQNTERSLEDRVDNWRAASATGDKSRITLKGQAELTSLRTTVFVEIIYQVTSSQGVKKTILLHQQDMYALLYQLSNRMEAVDAPLKLWSFDQADCKGGPLHEYFPAAGFRTRSGVTVGLLTDAGFRNGWSRIIRRDGVPVKPAPASVADLNLYELPYRAERAAAGAFVQQTFGETTVQLSGEGSRTSVRVPPIDAWTKRGKIAVKQNGTTVTVTPTSRKDLLLLPFPAAGGQIYGLSIKIRCAVPVSVHAWDVDDHLNKVGDLTLFNDSVPASPDELSDFRHSFIVPALQGSGAALVLSLGDGPEDAGHSGGALPSIEIGEIQLFRIATRRQPYHRLEMGKTQTTTVFAFASDTIADSLRGYRLGAQLQLADALGFRGNETEKVLYADVMMLSWNAQQEELRPMLAPSIWYSAAGEMYLRDSFYALNGIHNRELNERVFASWGDNQGVDGAINTLIEPGIANLERKSNDSTPLWLMWALLNRRRFGTELPMDKIRLAAEYCLATYDPERKGMCSARFVMGQLDVIQYPQGTSVLCENQGVLAVLLRVIQELKIPGLSESVSTSYIAMAEDGYRSYYDASRGFVTPARDIKDAIGFSDIFPEFLSLWLFNRPLLSDEMVVNHLNRIPAMLPRKDCPFPQEGGTVRPIFIGLPPGKSWSYFTEDWHPMVSDSYAQGYAHKAADGVYYNGGSWMRVEVCGYVTGKLHGWAKADRAVANRLWAEIHTDEDFPTSQEYLPTDAMNPFYGFHRVFAWNSFVLTALEVMKARTPEMDPDHLSNPISGY